MSEIRSKLEGVDWSSVYSINSVNESYDTFSSLLRQTVYHFLFKMHALNLTALQTLVLKSSLYFL